MDADDSLVFSRIRPKPECRHNQKVHYMKKRIAIVVLSLLMLCCQKKEVEFRGFGDLKLGADFREVEDFDKFDTTTSGEYYMAEYNLGDGFGPVSGLYVVTFDGKISEVNFSSKDETDLDAMKELYAGLQRMEIDKKMRYGQVMEIYFNKDSTLFMGIIKKEEGANVKKLRHKFTYSDKRAIEAKARRIKKNLQIPNTSKQKNITEPNS